MRFIIFLLLSALAGCADFVRDVDDLKSGKIDSWNYDYAPMAYSDDPQIVAQYSELKNWALDTLRKSEALGNSNSLGDLGESMISQAMGVKAWDLDGVNKSSAAHYAAARERALKVLADQKATLAKELADALGTAATPLEQQIFNLILVDQFWRKQAIKVRSENSEPDDEIGRTAVSIISRAANFQVQLADRQSYAAIKPILDEIGWPKISTHGKMLDQRMWLLVQHADAYPAFQREILKRLEPLVAAGETTPQNYAYLFDRVALADKQPQKYGTQVRCKNGHYEPINLSDPDHVDERRASVGLQSMAQYQAQMESLRPGFCK